MQCFNLNKDINLGYEIEDLLLIGIDDQIETIDDKEGVKVTGKIVISGNAKTKEGNKEFSDVLDIDFFVTYDEIEERNSLNISIHDFNYKIENSLLNLNIVLKIEGLKEIEATFPAEKDSEIFDEKEIEEMENIEENKKEKVYEEEEIEERTIFAENISIEEDIVINEVETPRLSLLKSVFSNKRVKEEVSWKLHCVRGETTYEQIASKYGVNLNKLIKINKNEELEDGKLIFLPLE